jgi:hypothetical protein
MHFQTQTVPNHYLWLYRNLGKISMFSPDIVGH